VLSATKRLKPASNGKTFTVKLGNPKTGAKQPLLVFAIASSKPLEALNLPPDARAEEVFPRLLTEASQRSLAFNVRAKYFEVQ
jgi:hypothetical protein